MSNEAKQRLERIASEQMAGLQAACFGEGLDYEEIAELAINHAEELIKQIDSKFEEVDDEI